MFQLHEFPQKTIFSTINQSFCFLGIFFSKKGHDDIIGSVRKILTKRVQRHQERSSMVTGVGHISGPKASEPQHFWTARVANFVHHLWPYLMSLDSSHRDIFNNTNVVIIRTSVCLNDLFFFTFLSLSPISSQITRRR